MAIQKIFRSAMPSFRFYSRNGTPAVFINGKFTTDNKELEAELMSEVGKDPDNIGRTKSQHPFIFMDEKEPTLDTEALSPMEQIKLQAKEEARRELLAEMAAQSARSLSMNAGTSTAATTASLNTTAKLDASMGTDVTLQALNHENTGAAAQAPQQEAAQSQQAAGAQTIQVTGAAARLAALKATAAQQGNQ